MATNGKLPVGVSQKIKQISRMDLPGGGSVVVENGYAYVGHIEPPHGTSIIDVRDPKHPKLVAQLEVPAGIHSHKVRVSGDVMLINYERYKTRNEPQGGLKIFDISNRAKPREIAFFKAAAKGVHRFTFDGRYAYLSPHMEGYIGNILLGNDSLHPGQPDRLNNVEVMSVEQPFGGLYAISVTASHLGSGPRQSYALVVTGDLTDAIPSMPNPTARTRAARK